MNPTNLTQSNPKFDPEGKSNPTWPNFFGAPLNRKTFYFWFLQKNWVMGRKLSIYLVGVCAALIGGRSVGGIGSYSSAGPGGIRVVRSRWHRSRWQVAETRSRDPSCSFSATGQVLPTDGLSQRWVCSTYIPSHCSALVVHHFLTGGWLAQNKLLS